MGTGLSMFITLIMLIYPLSIIVLSTIIHYHKTNRMLNVYNERGLCDIMGVSWKDRVTNEELLLSAGVGDLQDTGKQTKKIHRASTAPPHVKISQPSNRLDCRGRK